MKKVWIYLLVCCLASLTLACSLASRLLDIKSAPAKTQGLSGLIAYIGTDGNIYLTDQNGENVATVTKDANPSPPQGKEGRIYQQPTWSPDGRRLAYLGLSVSAQGVSNASLYTIASDGTDLVEAFSSTESFPFYLYWTPDSQSVSFLSNGSDQQSLILRLAPARGGESRTLGEGQPYYWAWSPKSDELIIHTGGSHAANPDAHLAFLKAGHGDLEELGLLPGQFQAPAWSSDGNQIVVAAEQEAGKVALVNLSPNGARRQVLAEVDGAVAFDLSPVGTSLAYTVSAPLKDNSGGFLKDLIVLDVNKPGEKKAIARDIVVGFFWSPDGQKIAFFAPVLPSPGEGKKTISNTVDFELGLFVADVGSGATRRVAAFVPTQAFIDILPFYDQYQRSTTVWSPDSQRLVFSVEGQGGTGTPGIFVVKADGSQEPQNIASGSLAFWSWK